MRINQYLAFCLGISRRQGDALVEGNKVRLNGKKPEMHSRVEEGDVVETQVGQNWARVKPKNLLTRENGRTVNVGQKVVVLMYKPIFCLTTREEKQDFVEGAFKNPDRYQSGFKDFAGKSDGRRSASGGKNGLGNNSKFGEKSKTEQKKGPRKIIYDFLPHEFRALKPAGRLDYMSEGLLVLTNDGDLIQSLTSAKNQTNKTYLVGLKQEFGKEQLSQMQGKVETLEIEKTTTKPSKTGTKTGTKTGIIVQNYELNPMKVRLLSKPVIEVKLEKLDVDGNTKSIKKTLMAETKIDTKTTQKLEKNGKNNAENSAENLALKNYNFLKLEPNLFWYEFTLNEGRNRQIRRVCEGFGQPVKRLIRVGQGDFSLNSDIKKSGFKIV